MADAPKFDPICLYHKGMEPVLVVTQAQYDAYMAEGGWVQSPADLGIITAPSVEQRASLPRVDPVPVPGPDSTPAERLGFQQLLMTWQHDLDALQEANLAMHTRVATVEHHLGELGTAGLALEKRVAAAEQWLVEHSPAEAEEKPTRRRGSAQESE